MKLLRKTIRNIIQEMAMKQGDDLPGGYYFAATDGVDSAYGFPQLLLVSEEGYVHWKYKVECYFTEMKLEDADIVNELGYKSFDLRRLDSDPSGFGPLVTEIAIEWVTLRGGILFPDRREMSQSAQRMWDKFSERPGFEEFIHPTLGVKGYRRIGRPVTMQKLESRNQLFRKRWGPGPKDPATAEYNRLSKDFEK